MSEFRRMIMTMLSTTGGSGGDIEDDDIIVNTEYMYIEALDNGVTVSLSETDCEYSTNLTTWTSLSAGSTTPSVSSGEKIYFRATPEPSWYGIGTFTINGRHNAGGNILSLLYGDNFLEHDSLEGFDYAFSFLFGYDSQLIEVQEGFLPATTLSLYCYSAMFLGCTNLVSAPQLNASILSEGCYDSMFYNCSSLLTAPTLPAERLMMGCYGYMFSNCSSLSYIKAMFTTEPSSSYTDYWVSGVSSSGIFVKNANATWNVTGENGIPSGWTVQTS